MNETEVALWGNVRSMCLDPSAAEYDVTEVSDALLSIIARVGEDNLPDHIAAAVESAIFNFDEGSLLIGVASYSTRDEGSSIQRVLDHWLETGSDELRILLALEHDTVPFRSRGHRIEVLTALAQRFPKFAYKCKQLLKAYG